MKDSKYQIQCDHCSSKVQLRPKYGDDLETYDFRCNCSKYFIVTRRSCCAIAIETAKAQMPNWK